MRSFAAGRVSRGLLTSAVLLLTAGCDLSVQALPGPAPLCEDHTDSGKSPVTVRFKNQSPERIYISSQQSCGGLDAFTLEDASGAPISWYLDSCPGTCTEQAERGSDCLTVCEQPPFFGVDPGSEYTMVWDGTVLRTLTIEAECHTTATSTLVCDQKVARPDALTMTGLVYTQQRGCYDDSGTRVDCPCVQAPGETWCSIAPPGAPDGVQQKTQPATLSRDQKNIELVFGDAP
ncbi:hypothetical protein [Chondromyces crocatus]|uniref:Lipoprotein n=1 Tax=Chondromyces crocatus TaxID=52 RepID=A0A0K1E9B4_CHOCO|nr:hypothetical protein [Chondromyces crocatus]AKT37267.1 uncharacterized protein CMC5_013980 [Chondromyces crocatus]